VEGNVTLLAVPTPDDRYRIVIAEYEEYLVDGTFPYSKTPDKKDRRLIFVEHVEIT
jgi:hypothetical protein